MSVEPIGPYLAPIVKSIFVELEPDAAFSLFTADMAMWWPRQRGHSVFAEASRTCGIEPFVGGEIFEESTTGERTIWGRVTRWEPGRAVEFTWHPGRGEETAQTVLVTFTGDAGGTRLTLEHRDWQKLGPAAEATRGRYVPGWTAVLAELERYATSYPDS